ncbi:MAG: hypothetical protein ACRCX2_20770 [Paraclostridium sp.]
MSFENPLNKIKNEANFYLEKQNIKGDAYKNLQYMSTLGSDVIYEATDRLTVEDLQDLGVSNYETFLKMSNLQNSTLVKYGGDLGAKVSDSINTIMPWIDTVSGALDSLNNIFVGEVFKRDLGTAPPSSNDKTIGSEDPISSKVDLRERVYNIVERCGYAQDKVLSIGYSRNYIFTKRPTLASDSSGHYKSFVFFTRPNLNLITKTDEGMYRLVPELANYDHMFSLVASDPKLYSELCRDGSRQSNLFRLLSNYVKEIPAVRLTDTERNGIENMYGHHTPMAGTPEFHNIEVSLTMMDNYRGDVAKLLYALGLYRHNVALRGYAMRPEYIKNKADDSLMSMYIITCNVDMEIVGFGVGLNGVVVDTPSHFTQHKMEGFNKEELLDNFNITIKFATYYPHAPKYFDYFNNIFNFNPLDAVDLKGQDYNMTAPGRNVDVQTSGNSTRAYLFGEDFGVKLNGIKDKTNATISKVQGYVDKYGKYIDTAKGIMNYADTYNTVKNLYQKGEVVHSAQYIESVQYNYKGRFEFLAKNPGVYVAASQNPLEYGRVIYKLGFSY